MHIKYHNKRMFLCFCLSLILIFSSTPHYAIENEDVSFHFSGGEGTTQSPYLISTVKDLIDFYNATLNDRYNSAVYKMTSDIDLGTHVWRPVGDNGQPFRGVFDGNGKKITLRKIVESQQIGLFSSLNHASHIKNLIINGQISMSLDLTESASFGLITAKAEGKIENCITEGKVELIITKGKSEFFFGGIAGRSNSSVLLALNKANLTLNRNEAGKNYLGGVVGELMGAGSIIKDSTNQGTLTGIYKGSVNAGGLVGFVGFGSKVENVLNTATVTMRQSSAISGAISYVGGIVGELRGANMDKALNQGRVYIEDSSDYVNQSIVAAGITGLAEMATLKNVGNEGNVETKLSMEQHAIGITKPGSNIVIENAYTKGNIYASSTNTKADLYVMGVGENATTANFYFSGSAKLKAGNYSEIKGDAIANIRPGDKTNIYNYCYWHSQYEPFPGYPTFNKATVTSKAFNTTTGKLSEAVNLNGTNQTDIISALNAWVKMKNSGYLTWKSVTEPTFDWQFGHIMPEYMKYMNTKEGKWLSTSNWALPWMNQADQLNLIPDVLLNKDMTQGITRKEFSALAVELYEYLKGSPVDVSVINPFTDVNERYVSQAYHLGVVTGVGNNLFSPNSILTREQACTMLTRVYKSVYWEDWTLENDSTYTLHALDIGEADPFTDDDFISDYARLSVYFMNKQKIIEGVGENIFAPSPMIGQSDKYGRATREQAFKIAIAMIEKFK